ncbi:MAG: glycosyltransferase family 4 protein [Chloroflexi bacterium]|nr:glycosyltransferase family 4 protein [Chloroflexota bacterium]
MKVLYATYRYNPTDLDLGSSLDYECYTAMLHAGIEVKVLGPVTDQTLLFERIEQKLGSIYKKITGKSSLKFPLSTVWRASMLLNHAVRIWKPDVVFSLFPSFFVFYKGNVPFVWELDTTFIGQEAEWPLYGNLALNISIWEEKKALSKADKVITMSKWSKDILINEYGVPCENIEIIPMSAALPEDIIPAFINFKEEKRLEIPLRILLVGRVYERKGIDIAIEVVKILNHQGIPTILTICGVNEKSNDLFAFTNFVGPYRKNDPEQLRDYAGWYKWANFLLHPARFEAAGIVPSEAAAFGTPTITNDTGGLATTVKHGESGIVLPRNSPPEGYTAAISDLIAHPEKYYALCKSTRQRYERELNSRMAGERLAQILKDVVNERK